MKLKTSISSVVLSLLTILFLCLGALNVIELVAVPANAQLQNTDCPDIIIGGDLNLSFPAGSHVRVYWGNSVTPAQRAIFTQALNNWTNGNGNGVVFFTEEGSGALYRYMTVSMVAPSNPDRRAEVNRQYWESDTGVLRGVDIIIDPAVTEPAALLNAMSHETGHTFGLGHTKNNVPTTSTAMSSYDRNIGKNDTTNGASGPTTCDHAAIDAVYANGGVQHSTATGEGGGSGGGGGEEGGDCRFNPEACDPPDEEYCIPQTCPEGCIRWDPYTGTCNFGNCEPRSCP